MTLSPKSVAANALLTVFITSSATLASWSGDGCNEYCGGECAIWDHNVTMVRNKFSIPSGSQTHTCYTYAFEQWDNVRGMEDVLSPGLTWPPDRDYTVFGDGWSDFSLVPASFIPGLAGHTAIEYDDTCVFSEELIVETDVYINSDLSVNSAGINQSEMMSTNSTGSSLMTMVHELGHAYGIDHGDRFVASPWTQFSVMYSGGPNPLVGSSVSQPREVSVLPWEAYIGRMVYPSGFGETNVMASAQWAESATDLDETTGSGTFEPCQSQTTMIRYNVVNRGTTNASVSNKFFLNTSPSAHAANGPYSSATWGTTVFFSSSHSGEAPFSWANVPVGTTFYLYNSVDPQNALSEHYEYDNVVRARRKIKVKAC